MSELITSKNPDEKFPVDARELHRQLESKRQFNNWIKNKIKAGGFIENEDFVTENKIVFRKTGERGASKQIDYRLTLNMGKHLCQMEGTARGKQVREYFILSEERLRLIQQNPSLLLSPDTITRLLTDLINDELIDRLADAVTERLTLSEEKNEKLLEENKALKHYHALMKLNKPLDDYLDDGRCIYIPPHFRKPRRRIGKHHINRISALDMINNICRSILHQPDMFHKDYDEYYRSC